MKRIEKVSAFTVEKVLATNMQLSTDELGVEISFQYGEHGIKQSLVFSNSQLEVFLSEIERIKSAN